MASPLMQPTADKFYNFQPEVVPKYRIQFKNAGKLSDVQGYVWYTPAILYLWGCFTDTILADIVQRQAIKLFWYRFDKPVFQGLSRGAGTDDSWNHGLWAARQEDWAQLVDSVLESVQFDIPHKLLYQYGWQTFSIYDPLHVDVHRMVLPTTPVITVNSFGVLTNLRQIAFDTRSEGVKTCPAVVSFKPDSLHVRAANRLFRREHLTQDKAFESYRQILLSTQDEQHRNQVQSYRRSHERRT